jgi:asparagine synthase (glutamine-hydrolysing)
VKPDGGLRTQTYWDVWAHTSPLTQLTDEAIADRTRAELESSVQLRAMSDVPVGIFLSGGVDSSTNAALFSRSSREQIKTFSIGYEGDFPSYRNEFEPAALVARTIGSDHHERRLSLDDLIDFLPRLVWHQDEPLADPVCVPLFYVAEMARKNGVVVAQVGEGADELFWGYPAWRTLHRLQRMGDLPVPRAFKQMAIWTAQSLGRGHRRGIELLARNARRQPIFWGGFERFSEAQKCRLLSPEFRRRLNGLNSWHALEPIWQDFQDNAWEKSILHWMSYLDLRYRLPELLLMRVDKMSMATSLEARVPFLDHRFVELALSIPEAVKIRDGELKTVLKQAVRGVIPDSIIDRPKQGFGVPVQEFLIDRLGPLVATELRDMCARTDYFDSDHVEHLLKCRDSGALWTLLNFSLWWRRFIANEELDLAA